MEFGSPSKPENFPKEKYVDTRLALVGVTYTGTVTTAYGDQEAADVNLVVILEGGDKGKEYHAVRFFGALAGCLRDVPSNVAGLLTQGAKAPGRNAPWLLVEDEKAVEIAERWAKTRPEPEPAYDDGEEPF